MLRREAGEGTYPDKQKNNVAGLSNTKQPKQCVYSHGFQMHLEKKQLLKVNKNL